MARREIIQYFDDFDDQQLTPEEVNVVEFAVDGTTYTMDLSSANREKFDAAIKPFIDIARRVPATTTRTRAAQATNTPERNRAIREWARREGLEVSARGRISQKIIDMYDEAH